MAAKHVEIDELDRRWEAFLSQSRVVSHDEVISWLRTWGTQEFKKWRTVAARPDRPPHGGYAVD
jgi:hypothetical protein